KDNALAHASHVADDVSVDGFDRWIDRSENERTEEVKTLEALADEARFQRLDVDDDVRELRQLIFLEPLHNLFARPVMIVVQMQDDGVERQPLVAAFGAAAAHVLEAV